jgi:hypothetical protein
MSSFSSQSLALEFAFGVWASLLGSDCTLKRSASSALPSWRRDIPSPPGRLTMPQILIMLEPKSDRAAPVLLDMFAKELHRASLSESLSIASLGKVCRSVPKMSG